MNNILYIKRPRLKRTRTIAEILCKKLQVEPIVQNMGCTVLSNENMIVAIYKRMIDVVLLNDNLNSKEKIHLIDSIQTSI